MTTPDSITDTAGKDELLAAIDDVLLHLTGLMSSLDESSINTVPYKDSWTAGQLFEHVIKSTAGIAKALSMKADPAERNPGERIAELRKTFLDFSIKMQSPEAIVPAAGPYKKQVSIDKMNASFTQLKESAAKAELTEMVKGLPLGDITKLELLHFVLYHTQRHLHQMKKICTALEK